MPRSALQGVRKTAYEWLIVQVVIVVIISLFLAIFRDIYSARSALLGGMVCILPNLFFARNLFVTVKSFDPKRLVKAFYVGEMTKLVLTGVLVVLVFKYFAVNTLGFFLGFITAQFGFWLAPFISAKVR